MAYGFCPGLSMTFIASPAGNPGAAATTRGAWCTFIALCAEASGAVGQRGLQPALQLSQHRCFAAPLVAGQGQRLCQGLASQTFLAIGPLKAVFQVLSRAVAAPGCAWRPAPHKGGWGDPSLSRWRQTPSARLRDLLRRKAPMPADEAFMADSFGGYPAGSSGRQRRRGQCSRGPRAPGEHRILSGHPGLPMRVADGGSALKDQDLRGQHKRIGPALAFRDGHHLAAHGDGGGVAVVVWLGGQRGSPGQRPQRQPGIDPHRPWGRREGARRPRPQALAVLFGQGAGEAASPATRHTRRPVRIQAGPDPAHPAHRRCRLLGRLWRPHSPDAASRQLGVIGGCRRAQAQHREPGARQQPSCGAAFE